MKLTLFKLPPAVLFAALMVTPALAIKITVPKQYEEQVEAIKKAEQAERQRQLEGVEAGESADSGGLDFTVTDGEQADNKPKEGAGEGGEANEFLKQSLNEAANTANEFAEEAPENMGFVSGQIVDKESGQPVSGVAILLEGTDIGTITGSDGRYSLGPAPAGEYTINFVKSGYIPANVAEFAVAAGEVSVFPFALPPRPAEMSDQEYVLQDFTVTAEEANQLMMELDLRRDSLATMDMLSSEDFSKFAASDAAEAISKMSGASLSDGKYVVMRGLNDRYNTTLINGVRLPSPDPDRKAVAMDIFPTSLFEGIIARKTYTADQPGESSGGSIELKTKSIPEEPFINLSYGIGMQEQTTGENVLSDPERVGFRDWLFGDDVRGYSNAPGGDELLSNYSNRVGGINFPLMAPVSREAPFDQSFSFSAGGRYEVNDWLTIGGIFGTKMGFSTRSKVTEIDQTNIEEGRFIQDEKGVAVSGSDEYDAAFLIGLGADIGQNTSLNYTYLRSDTLSSTATEKTYKQLDEEVDADNQLDFVDTEISVEDRMLEAHQFSGEHRFDTGGPGDWTLSWYYTAAEMAQSEPDQRLIDGLRLNPDGTLFLPGSNNIERVRGLRFNRETEQDSDMLGAKIESPKFSFGDDIVFSFMLGANREDSEREFEQLETEVRNEAFIFGDTNQSPNPLIFSAMPVPDGSGLGSIFQDSVFLNNVFADVFAEQDGNGGINSLIESIYDRQISVILPGQINSRTNNFNNKVNQFNAQQNQVTAIDTNLQNTISVFEGFFGIDYETQFDPGVPQQQQFFSGFIEPIEQDLQDAQTELTQFQTEVDSAQQQLNATQADLNTISSERDAYVAAANALIAQISTMPALATDSTAFPTYSYFGDTNYILDTPVGFSVYADQNPNLANQFPIVTNKYTAVGKSEDSSIFISGDLKLFDRFRLAAGVRHESTLLSYDLLDPIPGEPPASTGVLGSSFEPFVIEPNRIDQSDTLPFASLIIDITENLKLQLAWSRTIAKPTFREIAPFPIFNLTDGSIEYGNPGLTVINEGIIELRENNGEELIDQDYVVTPDFAGLDIANVESRDIRLEWFTPLDGLVAIGYFEKTVGAPIERVQALQINGIDINTFINNDNEADLKGFEFELQQNLGVLGDNLFGLPLSWITVGGNYTKLDAEVERSGFEKNNLTNARFNNRLIDPDVFQTGAFSSRPLYDQPEYVANAFVSFDLERTGTRITLSQNWLGKQLDRAGGLSGDNVGSADLFWQDFSSLSLVIQQQLTDHIKLSFTVKNLDSPVRELAEDDRWNSLLVDGNRFVAQPPNNDPGSPGYQAVLTDFGDFRTSQTIEPTYSISISGSF